MDNQTILEGLKQFLPKSLIKVNEPLKKYTFTKTGGNADFYLSPTSYKEVQMIIDFAYTNQIPLTFLGNGSNIIIRDGGIRGIVISLLQFNQITVKNQSITCGSGAAIIDVSRRARDHHLTGLEFACGIPGSIGGAVYMNAGAYGGEVKDCIDYIKAVDDTGHLHTIKGEDLELDYRTSIVQRKHLVVLEATFKLKDGDIHTIKATMDDLTQRREDKQPLEYPSCGSVFQRPPNNFAGKLIQDSDLQGHRIGGVEVSKKHAGFIVNVDNGTATDYENIIKHVQKVVKEKFDVELKREVRIIGEPLED
ncbi:UDP-N-acetylmuramate dehydrogenase [Mammaliicoccus sp. Dog046]|uniref:UDP-N-acetylmuramate dehydrogenase n=1 Tax=Mammaliicoccus sp. Dog046 TaxID=3034233 RepID=UPI002B258FCD|nr:UDP-N-acetylmuramate dehydrogenase [Mammaliicoccus sp. Dog046]WQK85019.1 UDP-N-acetylmuramate dehydrogenase [Mammaliicoccus sp. Dog046]